MSDIEQEIARLASMEKDYASELQRTKSKSYLISIDEPQRVALWNLLRSQDNVSPALEYFVEMLDELPEVEEANPRIIHGFCL